MFIIVDSFMYDGTKLSHVLVVCVAYGRPMVR